MKDNTLVTQLLRQQSKSKAQNQPGRDPLPDRLKRNVHPAALPQKRRSTQEVAAECEEKRKALEAKIRELEEAKDTLAEMDALEDIQIDKMEDNNPQRLSFAVRKRAHTELEADSDGEKFDFAGIEAIEDSSGDDQPANNERVSTYFWKKIEDQTYVILYLWPKKSRKVVKGALRKDIQKRVEKMQQGDGNRAVRWVDCSCIV